MATQGTTPRQYTDLLGSLADLTSGSGDKGTPFVYIKGYFKIILTNLQNQEYILLYLLADIPSICKILFKTSNLIDLVFPCFNKDKFVSVFNNFDSSLIVFSYQQAFCQVLKLSLLSPSLFLLYKKYIKYFIVFQ